MKLILDEGRMTLLEGDYRDNTQKLLKNCGLFSEEQAMRIYDGMVSSDFAEEIVRPPKDWLYKYLYLAARLAVDAANNTNGSLADKQNAFADVLRDENLRVLKKFIQIMRDPDPENPDQFIRDKEGGSAWDKRAVNGKGTPNGLTLQDVINYVYDYEKTEDAKAREAAGEVGDDRSSSNYELIPIRSYKQLHDMFGGPLTGDGTDAPNTWAGNGGTAWCHTNSEGVYDNNYGVRNGNKFYILARKDWKDLHYDEESSARAHGKDDYGNSLLALVVNPKGKLLYCTLRGNHMPRTGGGLIGGADQQYKYDGLAKLAGFDVASAIYDDLGIVPGQPVFIISDGVFKGLDDEDRDEKDRITTLTVPNNVTKIKKGACRGWSNLEKVILPPTCTTIEADVFADCSKLTEINLENVTSLGLGVFGSTKNAKPGRLASITFSESLSEIPDFAFVNQRQLKEVIIPASVRYIKRKAFGGCRNLEKVILLGDPEIASDAFMKSKDHPEAFAEIEFIRE